MRGSGRLFGEREASFLHMQSFLRVLLPFSPKRGGVGTMRKGGGGGLKRILQCPVKGKLARAAKKKPE